MLSEFKLFYKGQSDNYLAHVKFLSVCVTLYLGLGCLHSEAVPAPPLLQVGQAALPALEERAAAGRAGGDAEPPGLTRAVRD